MLLQMALSHSFSWLSRSPPYLLYPRVYPSSTVSSSVGFSGSILPSIPASPMFLPLNQLDPRCRIGRCLPFHPVSNQSIHSVSVPFKGLDAAPPSVFLSCFLGVTLSLHTCAVGKGSWPASSRDPLAFSLLQEDQLLSLSLNPLYPLGPWQALSSSADQKSTKIN